MDWIPTKFIPIHPKSEQEVNPKKISSPSDLKLGNVPNIQTYLIKPPSYYSYIMKIYFNKLKMP